MNTAAVAWCWGSLQIVGLLAQLLVSRSGLWRWRHSIGGVLLAWYVVTFPLIFVSGFSVIVDIMAATLAVYTMVNVTRWWQNRFSEVFLRRSVVQNSWWLTATSITLVAVY